MVKVTEAQRRQIEAKLDDPKELQMLGAALVHTMLDQLKTGVDVTKITMPIAAAGRIKRGGAGPISDSIGVSANEIVSVGWSKDLKNVPGIDKERWMPKGLEAGKRAKVIR